MAPVRKLVKSPPGDANPPRFGQFRRIEGA
jgi:hypothetical protein